MGPTYLHLCGPEQGGNRDTFRRPRMLILSRKIGEKVFIGDDITVMVIDVDRGKIRLGIEAPRDVPVFREELVTRGQRDAAKDQPTKAAQAGNGERRGARAAELPHSLDGDHLSPDPDFQT